MSYSLKDRKNKHSVTINPINSIAFSLVVCLGKGFMVHMLLSVVRICLLSVMRALK